MARTLNSGVSSVDMGKTSGKTSSTVLELLRARPGEHARSLAEALVEDTLARRLVDLAPPRAVAKTFADGLRATAEAPELTQWLKERALAYLDWADERFDGTVEDHLAPELAESVRRSVARPYRVDPDLVASVLRHRQVRTMLREGLENLLLGFGRSLTSAVSGGGRAGALAGIVDVAKSMTTMIRTELDRQLEGRAREFVEETLDRGVEKWTSRLSTAESARRMADSRAKMTDVLLEQPVRHFVAIPRTADVAELATAAAEEIRLLAQWDGLEAEIEGAIEAALEPLSDMTLADLLEDSGLIESWRRPIEDLLSAHLATLFESEPFGRWLEDVERSSLPSQRRGSVKKKKKKKRTA